MEVEIGWIGGWHFNFFALFISFGAHNISHPIAPSTAHVATSAHLAG
jgi:hypothetical protein